MATGKQKKQTGVEALLERIAQGMREHQRYADLEKLIDAMYDRVDAFTPDWNNQLFDMQCELAALADKLQREEK